MDWGAWWAIVYRVPKELDMTWPLNTHRENCLYHLFLTLTHLQCWMKCLALPDQHPLPRPSNTIFPNIPNILLAPFYVSHFYSLLCMHVWLLSHAWLFKTPWTVAWQVPLSTGFSRQEYWSGLPCPPPGDLPNPGIELASLISPALAGSFLTHWTTWEAQGNSIMIY